MVGGHDPSRSAESDYGHAVSAFPFAPKDQGFGIVHQFYKIPGPMNAHLPKKALGHLSIAGQTGGVTPNGSAPFRTGAYRGDHFVVVRVTGNNLDMTLVPVGPGEWFQREDGE